MSSARTMAGRRRGSSRGVESAIRIAMWSGPRSLSTALMRAWSGRPDTAVWDEPFYAHYLLKTTAAHPGRAEVLARNEADWRRVAVRLTCDAPGGKRIFYQKHMAHHLLPGMTGAWLSRLTHAFLIRAPRDMLASLARVIPNPSLEETGLPQQRMLFGRLLRDKGVAPPVIDAADVLADARGVLGRLCAALGVPFREEMLAWETGPRDTDGVWGPYWYGSLWRSTGFGSAGAGAGDREKSLPPHLESLCARCERLYGELYAHRLR